MPAAARSIRQKLSSARQLGAAGLAGRALWRARMLGRIASFSVRRSQSAAFTASAWRPSQGIPPTFLADPASLRRLIEDECLDDEARARIMRQADSALDELVEIRGHGTQRLRLSQESWYDYSDLECARMINRHDFLIPLCQAHFVTGANCYRNKINELFGYWCGTFRLRSLRKHDTPIDAAIRLLNWVWPLHFRLLDDAHSAALKRSIFLQLEYVHTYASAGGNHLVLEALANYVYGMLLGGSLSARRWRDVGFRTLHREIRRQVAEDGVHTEQSTFYHQAVTTHFLKAFLTAHRNGQPFPTGFASRLHSMLDVIHDTVKPDLGHPALGDGEPLTTDDREHWEAKVLPAARAHLFDDPIHEPFIELLNDTSLWFLGLARRDCMTTKAPPASRIFPKTGLAVLRDSEDYLLLDAAPFGDPHFPHHGHADALSIELCLDGRSLIVDSGGYGYYDDPFRRYFRSTAAHNTIRLDGREQSQTHGVLGYGRLAQVRLESWQLEGAVQKLSAVHAGYAPVRHRREIYFVRPRASRPDAFFLVLDWLLGRGRHFAEAFYHLAPGLEIDIPKRAIVPAEHGAFWDYCSSHPAEPARSFGSTDPEIQGWHSPTTRERVPAAVLCISGHTELPFWLGTVFSTTKVSCRSSATDRLTVESPRNRFEIRLDELAGKSAPIP